MGRCFLPGILPVTPSAGAPPGAFIKVGKARARCAPAPHNDDPAQAGRIGGEFHGKRMVARDFNLAPVDASGGRQLLWRMNRRNPTASSDATSSRRSSTDMAAGSSRCMGAPRPARADACTGRAFAHNDLRSAAGELSGGDEWATLRVNSVLLHYLPPTSSKCLLRGWDESGVMLRQRSASAAARMRRPLHTVVRPYFAIPVTAPPPLPTQSASPSCPRSSTCSALLKVARCL